MVLLPLPLAGCAPAVIAAGAAGVGAAAISEARFEERERARMADSAPIGVELAESAPTPRMKPAAPPLEAPEPARPKPIPVREPVAAETAPETARRTEFAAVEVDRGASADPAVAWHCDAAEAGDATARAVLGTHYQHGWAPFPQDKVRAYLWFALAEQSGHVYGGTWKEQMAAEMTPRERAEAERMVKNWNPGQCGKP